MTKLVVDIASWLLTGIVWGASAGLFVLVFRLITGI